MSAATGMRAARRLSTLALAAMLAAPASAATPTADEAASRGVRFELRLAARGPIAGTYADNLQLDGPAAGEAALPAVAPFSVGYLFGRLYLALGLNLLRDSGGTSRAAAGGGVTGLWLAPAVGYDIVPARAHRASLFVEGALHYLLAAAPPLGSTGSTLQGFGLRAALGSRVPVLPSLSLGLEAGAAYDDVTFSWGVVDQSLRQTGLGLYGAVTIVVVIR